MYTLSLLCLLQEAVSRDFWIFLYVVCTVYVCFQHGERMHLNRLKLAIKYRQKKVTSTPLVTSTSLFISIPAPTVGNPPLSFHICSSPNCWIPSLPFSCSFYSIFPTVGYPPFPFHVRSTVFPTVEYPPFPFHVRSTVYSRLLNTLPSLFMFVLQHSQLSDALPSLFIYPLSDTLPSLFISVLAPTSGYHPFSFYIHSSPNFWIPSLPFSYPF